MRTSPRNCVWPASEFFTTLKKHGLTLTLRLRLYDPETSVICLSDDNVILLVDISMCIAGLHSCRWLHEENTIVMVVGYLEKLELVSHASCKYHSLDLTQCSSRTILISHQWFCAPYSSGNVGIWTWMFGIKLSKYINREGRTKYKPKNRSNTTNNTQEYYTDPEVVG